MTEDTLFTMRPIGVIHTLFTDIKPYVPDFDIRADVCTGWYATRNLKE